MYVYQTEIPLIKKTLSKPPELGQAVFCVLLLLTHAALFLRRGQTTVLTLLVGQQGALLMGEGMVGRRVVTQGI